MNIKLRTETNWQRAEKVRNYFSGRYGWNVIAADLYLRHREDNSRRACFVGVVRKPKSKAKPKRCSECRNGEHANYDDNVDLVVVINPTDRKIYRRAWTCDSHKECYAADGYDIRIIQKAQA